MYKTINDLPRIIDEANRFVMENDRSLYDPFLRVIEQYCIDNAVLIGGMVGTDLLINKPLSKDSYQWELFADDTYNVARRLADELYKVKSPHIDSRLIALRTDIKHREFTIMVNLRMVAKIHNLDRYRGLKLYDLMGPAARTGYFTKNIVKLIPEEIQIIELYRSLYSPGRFDRWEMCLNAENIIYGLIKETLGAKAAIRVEGGARESRHNVAAITDVLMKKLIAKSDYVIIGDFATTLYGSAPKLTRLQFLISEPIDVFIVTLRHVVTKHFPNIPPESIIYVKYPVCLPTDFQIAKYTIYIQREGGQDSVADLYNSPAYELIPFRMKNNMKYGNPYVVLRFRFIELWILKLIANIDKNSQNFLAAKMKDLINTIEVVRNYILEADPAELFQLEDYVGVYRDEDVVKKKSLQRFPLYYPYKAELAATSSTDITVDLAADADVKPIDV